MGDEQNALGGGGSLTPREKAELHLKILGRKARDIWDGSGSDEQKINAAARYRSHAATSREGH